MEGRQKKGKQQQQQQQQQQKPGQREKPQTGVRISCGKYAQHTAFPDWLKVQTVSYRGRAKQALRTA